MRRSIAGLLVAVVVLSSAAGGQQTETLKAHAGLRELRFPAVAQDADVTWEAKQPLDLDWRSFELLSGEMSFVWCARAGETYVVAIDVIDWEARQRTRKTWIVEVEGDPDPGPGPNPPGPDPPEPGPDPPDTEFAREVFEMALKVNRPADCKTLAGNFEAVSSMIAAGGVTTPDEAASEIRRINKPLAASGAWNEFGTIVGRKMNMARTLNEVRELFAEVAKGLDAACPR